MRHSSENKITAAAATTKQPQKQKRIKRIKCGWEWGVLQWREHLDLVTKKYVCMWEAKREEVVI